MPRLTGPSRRLRASIRRRARRRLLRLWSRTTAQQRALGAAWYPDARLACLSLAACHGRPPLVVAAAVAALSPRVSWPRNLELVDTLLVQVAARRSPVMLAALPRHVEIARRVVQGEGSSALCGPKVRAFYRALAGDDDACVIDVWMRRVLGHTERQLLNGYRETQYANWACALADAANYAGVRPCTFQSTLWLQAKEDSDAA